MSDAPPATRPRSRTASPARPASPRHGGDTPLSPAARRGGGPTPTQPQPRPGARPPAVRRTPPRPLDRPIVREVDPGPSPAPAAERPERASEPTTPAPADPSPSPTEREGIYSGQPTTIPELPSPPFPRSSSGAAEPALRLPDPPRPAPAQDVTSADSPHAGSGPEEEATAGTDGPTGGGPDAAAPGAPVSIKTAKIDIELPDADDVGPQVLRPLPDPPRDTIDADHTADEADAADQTPTTDPPPDVATPSTDGPTEDATPDDAQQDPTPEDATPEDATPDDDPHHDDPSGSTSNVDPVAESSTAADEDPLARAESPSPDAVATQATTDLSEVVGTWQSGVDATARPWIRQYAPGVPDTYRYPLVPLTRLLDDAAQDFPDTPGISFLGSRVTFRQMATQVDQLATALTELGLKAGDRIAVALPWIPQLVLMLNACWRLGVEVVLIDPEESPEVVAEGIRETEPAAILILDTTYGGLVEFRSQLRSVRHVIATGLLDALPAIKARMQSIRLKVQHAAMPEADGVLPFRAVLESASPVATQAAVDVEATTATSTVIGGVTYAASHHNVLAGAFQARLWIPDVRAGRESVMVAGNPTDSFGLAAGIGLALLSAATLVLPDPRPGGVAKSIDAERPTILVTSMDQVRTMLAPASKRRDLSSVRVTIARGVHFDPVVKRAAESRTAGRFRMAYSGAAVSGIAHAESVYADGASNGAGLPVTDTVVECLDDAGTPTEPDTVGALVASGPQVAGEQVPLGLIGSISAAGYVSVIGAGESVVRLSDGAADVGVVRTALRRSPDVVEVEVQAVPDGRGVGLAARVSVTREGITQDTLRKVLTENAPAQSHPTEWHIEVVSAGVDPDEESTP
ncbi:AMP-binding protein [Euzebya tangerina]|uniref:AMP-binding protein n=1 Tax=Euzebya tangerina TaxID=591198 RepID=UPI002F318C72